MERSASAGVDAASDTAELQGATRPGAIGERRPSERRAAGRRGRLLAAGQRRDGLVLDVSANRVRMRLDAPLPLGTPVALALAGSVHFGGEVVWRQGVTHGIAFRRQPERLAEIAAVTPPDDGCAIGHV